MENAQVMVLEDILDKADIEVIINQTKPGSQLVDYDLKPASQGVAGLLGEHYRLTLSVRDGSSASSVFLFVKVLPITNKSKADFISKHKFFMIESLIYDLIYEIGRNEDRNPWHTKAYIKRENIVVMPDLIIEGYKTHSMETTFDLNHVLVSLTSIARFHASFSNLVTKKSLINPYNFLSKYGHIIEETQLRDSPFLRAGAKLTNNFLKEFSSKWTQYPKNLLEQIVKLYITGCCSLKDYDETLNVVIHRDLWVNNILFKYEGDIPVNAVIIDFQCIRYGPPAFDIMLFLYLNTSRAFREIHENNVLCHYFTVFIKNISDDTKSKLKDYNLEVFLSWCERARLFGIYLASLTFPTVMMDPIATSKYFDDPDTFMEYMTVDRSYPVIKYAKRNHSYKHRLLEIFEEIVDRYMLI